MKERKFNADVVSVVTGISLFDIGEYCDNAGVINRELSITNILELTKRYGHVDEIRRKDVNDLRDILTLLRVTTFID